MIERRDRAPYDRVTGLAYCIAPPEKLLRPADPDNSWHHPHHSEEYLLSLGELGRMVRTSRLQLAHNVDHNFGKRSYHAAIKRSKVPQSEIGKIRIGMFGAVNAVPDKVFDFPRGEVRPITEEERQRLFMSGELRMQSDFPMRRVLTRFTIEKGISHLTRSEINRYKDARHADTRESIANDIIGRFLPIAFEPINDRYAEAVERGMLPAAAPPNPAEVARQFVFSEPQRFDVFNEVFFVRLEERDVA